jgi:hypothetical protein
MMRRARPKVWSLAISVGILWALRFFVCAALGGLIAWIVGINVRIGLETGFVVGVLAEIVIFHLIRRRGLDPRRLLARTLVRRFIRR